MKAQEIKQEVGRNEMEKMIENYFETDPDLFVNHENDEIYSILSTTNKHWNRLDLLSNALIPCSNINSFEQDEDADDSVRFPTTENFEIMILNIIENIYLCDTTQLITFLLLIDDIGAMHKSFNAVLANKNIPRFNRTQIVEIAIKYFAYQTINRLQQYLEYEESNKEDEETMNAVYAVIPSNITEVFSMDIVDDGIDVDDEEEEEAMTIEKIVKCAELIQISDEDVIKCHKRAVSYFEKWCKITK